MASRRLLTITFLASVCLASAQKAVDPLNLVLRQFLVQAATGEAGTHEQLLASPECSDWIRITELSGFRSKSGVWVV